jgi:hypothetical protein
MTGKNVTITYGGKTIALTRAQTIDFSADMEEVEPLPGASDAEWAVYRPTGIASWRLRNEGLYAAGDDIRAMIDSIERVNVVAAAGNLRISGACVLSDASSVAEVGAIAKLSANMAGDDLPLVYLLTNN